MWFFFGCAAGEQLSEAPGDTGEEVVCEPVSEEPPERFQGDEPRPARTLSGSVTWTVDFDADAEALGYVDCQYTRDYAELVEVVDEGWVCPSCRWMVAGEAEMTAGYQECYLQLDSADAVRVEQLGVGSVGGVDHFFRSGNDNVELADTESVVVDEADFDVAWESEGELGDGGSATLSATGHFTQATSESVLVEDPRAPHTEPYACGWPLMNPGGPVESWAIVDGGVLPNARLMDACTERVDLWDFRGRYLVIDASSPNCGPCQAMAEGAEAFKAQMEAECLHVELVTLLNQELSAVNLPADGLTLVAWKQEFGLSSPVLADKGYGYALFPDYLSPGETGMSLPSTVVVGPDGRVIGGATGFSVDAGGWEVFGQMIREHAGR